MMGCVNGATLTHSGERNNLIIWNHNHNYRRTEDYLNKEYHSEQSPPDLRFYLSSQCTMIYNYRCTEHYLNKEYHRLVPESVARATAEQSV
jgi:hypothetical protein